MTLDAENTRQLRYINGKLGTTKLAELSKAYGFSNIFELLPCHEHSPIDNRIIDHFLSFG